MRTVRSVEVVQKELEAGFAELAELLTAEVSEGEVTESVVRAERLRSMAEAHSARAAGLLASSKAWVPDGARSARAWMQWRTRVPGERAGRALATARRLLRMPVVEAAFVAGDLTDEHVRLLASARRTNPEAFEADGEVRLTGLARELPFGELEKAVRYWCELAAPDDAEERARRRYEDRSVHCSRTIHGTVAFNGVLDPIGGEIVARELDRLGRLLFEEDLAEARDRLGTEHPPLDQLRRSAPQRRADALALMAERSASKVPGATEPRVLLHVLAGHDSVDRMCELSNGTVVTPGEVLPLLAEADVERVIFDGPSKVIDVGVRRRFFTGATRTAIQLRDRTCTHPSCSVPAEACEIDHVTEWARGGLTTQDNGRCRCAYHHRRARDG
jgi:hypothetical protein